MRGLILPPGTCSKDLAKERNGNGLVLRGRFGTEATRVGLTPDMLTNGTPENEERVRSFLRSLGEEGKTWWQKIVLNTWNGNEPVTPLSIRESIDAAVHGFGGFTKRDGTSTALEGVSLKRIAGQAIDLKDPIMRASIIRDITKTVDGGVFLVLGHNDCGAVKGRIAHLKDPHAFAKSQPKEVIKLVKRLGRDLAHQNLAAAEWCNAQTQAIKLLHDDEIRELLDAKNITIVYAVARDDTDIIFAPIRGPHKTPDELSRHVPMLNQLKAQLVKGFLTALAEGKGPRHAAHSIAITAPHEIYPVLNPSLATQINEGKPFLTVSGICCADGRLRPNPPDGAQFLFRAHYGEYFNGSAHRVNGGYVVSAPVAETITYALYHVAGINILKNPESGNGVFSLLATTMENAELLERALLEIPAARQAIDAGGSTILYAYGGKGLSVRHNGKNERIEKGYTLQELTAAQH